MSETIVEDFVKKFKEDYSIEDYQGKQLLSNEDALFMYYSLLNILNGNQDAQCKYEFLNTLKSLPKYADYFSLKKNEIFVDKIKLSEMIEEFIQTPLQGNSGIAYSDKKTALKADNQIFHESVIEKTSLTYGMDIKEIKKLLAPKLEDYLNNKFAYYQQALLNEHGLYNYSSVQK